MQSSKNLQNGSDIDRAISVKDGSAFHRNSHEIRQCSEKNCGLRFPVAKNEPRAATCPHCSAPTQHRVDIITEVEGPSPTPTLIDVGESPVIIEVLLDNVRSLFNVGSIFRCADGFGVSHLYLCGITPTPENPKLRKTALGAEQTIPWTQSLDGFDAVQQLQRRGHHIWALECPLSPQYNSLCNTLQDSINISSLPQIFSIYSIPILEDALPITLVVGNEVTGVDPQILALCEYHLYIPMQGIKRSLNVANATAIALSSIKQANT